MPQNTKALPVGYAWLIVGCVAVVGVFSFNSTKVFDLALAIVAVSGGIIWAKGNKAIDLPIALSIAWIGFVILEATYATLLGLPGHHFGYLGKHLPIALGPIVALALVAGCDRANVSINALTGLFFASIAAGAAILLIRNGGVSLAVGAWAHPQSVVTYLGEINRNFAAFSAGLSIIATATLIAHILTTKNGRMAWKIFASILLYAIHLWCIILVLLIQSRTAYAATAFGFFVCIGGFLWAGLRRSGNSIKTTVAISIALTVVLVGIVLHSDFLINGRLMMKGTVAGNFSELGQIVVGQASHNTGGGEARLELISVAMDLIRNRLLTGWGTDVSRLIGLYSPFEDIKALTQFHNGYLQVLVHFGILGALLMVVLVGAILRSALLKKTPHLSPALLAGCIAIAAYIAIFNLTESIFLVGPAAAVCVFLSALACINRRGTAI